MRADRSFGQLRDAVDAEIASSLRPSTVSTYRYQWKGALVYIPAETPVSGITRELLQDVVSRMSATRLSPATVRKNMEAVNRLLVRAVEDGALDRNPMEKVKLPRKPARAPRFLTAEQRLRLLEVAREDGPDAHLLIALGVYLGLRKAELLALRWEEVDLAQRVAHVQNQEFFTTKNARNRAIPMCDELCAILGAHRRSAGFVLRPANVYQSGKRYRWEFRGLFRALSTSAGIGRWMTPHVMRHTFASLAAQAGVSLYKIGQWMGHSSSEVTEIYAHLAAYDSDINLMAPASAARGSSPDALRLVPPVGSRVIAAAPGSVTAG